jgi:hypothetical protein
VSTSKFDFPTESHPGSATAQPEPPATTPPADGRLDRARRWLILGGLAAGLVAFGIGEFTFDLIPAQDVPIDRIGHVSTGPSVETSNIAAVRNGALTFGVLGVCLGGFLGIAGGATRRSAPGSVTGGLVGSVLSMVLAVAASFALLPYFLRAIPNNPDYDIILSMIMHGTIWGLVGAAAGLAFAVGVGRPKLIVRFLGAGFGGAVIGAIAFDLLGGGLFPLANTGQPISITWPTRFLARLIVTVASAGAIGLLLPGSRPSEPRAGS